MFATLKGPSSVKPREKRSFVSLEAKQLWTEAQHGVAAETSQSDSQSELKKKAEGPTAANSFLTVATFINIQDVMQKYCTVKVTAAQCVSDSCKRHHPNHWHLKPLRANRDSLWGRVGPSGAEWGWVGTCDADHQTWTQTQEPETVICLMCQVSNFDSSELLASVLAPLMHPLPHAGAASNSSPIKIKSTCFKIG